MAKQIEELLIRLKTEGYEEVTKLKSAFRGLESALGQSDEGLSEIRKGLLDLANKSQRSEALIKGLESAFKGLRSQAELHSPLYTQLTQDIKELSAAQREYIVDLNSTKSAYASLAVAEEGAARRAAKLRNIQQLAVEKNPLAVAGRRSTEFGGVPQVAPGPGGVFIAPPGRSTPFRPGTQYDRPIGPQPISQQMKSAERAVEQAMQGINDAMERSLNERARLQEKYQQRQYDQLLEGLDLEGRARKQAFDRELADFDARLAATEKRRKRRFSGMQAAQVAGAAISGGIFGGPEGFLGGVAGGALGGVGGAFAGAAIGAQVAGLRQAAGAAAEYAAAINQQRRALEGVVEDNAAYQQSLAFIDQTSRQLAIPQEQVTRNFTRLSASVLGAGGNVEAAQEAFMGIAAGIRGTGGSLADLDAALLATAQVFSKGKVSAEELRGQIGERLPGAFTLFAESIGKTPQELDKMLEKGQVTLNDFMSFIRRLSGEFGQTSVEMAASGEAAGDRLATAFGRAQEEIGNALRPIGAEFQDIFADFVTQTGPAVVGGLVAIGRAALELTRLLGNVFNGIRAYLDEITRQVTSLVETWTARWRALTSFISSAFTGAAQAVGIDLNRLGALFSSVADFISRTFGAVFGRISSGWKQTVENMVNLSSPIAWVARLMGVNPGKAVAAGLSAAAGGGQQSAPPATFTPPPRSTATFGAEAGAEGAGGKKGAKGPKPPEDRTQDLAAELKLLQQVGAFENNIRDALFQGRERYAAELEFAKQLVQIEYERDQALKAANYEGERVQIRLQAEEKAKQALLQQEDRLREINNQRFQQQLQNEQALRDAIEPLKQAKEQQELQLQNTKEYTRLVMEGVLPGEAERIINWQNLVAQQLKSLDTEIKITEEAIAQAEIKNQEAGKEVVATKALREQLALRRRQREAVQTQAQAGPGRGATEAEKITQQIGEVRGELNQLAAISTQVITHANAIGDAFSEAFIKLITGAGSARQVLSDFFSRVAKSFLDMAGQIIAKQITMLILQTALKALGAVSGGAGAPIPNLQSGSDFGLGGQISTGMGLAASGRAYGKQGPIEMFARGGVVNSPTPFYFSKGGAFAPGLMGEAGPEAVLPLQRGPDGRLGVSIYDASRRAVASAESAAAANAAGYADEGMELGGAGMTSADRRASLAATSAAAAATRTQVTQQQLISEKRAELREFQQMLAQPARLDVEFKSQVINNVEYVTKEQAERMAAQSAVRGREMTLNALQTSVKTRKRVGMGR